MDLYYILVNTCLVSSILIIWFDTNAFVEYASMFEFQDSLFIEDYKNKSKDAVGLSYPLYLAAYRNCFVSRIVSCHVCLALWLSVFACFYWSITATFVVFVASLIIYRILSKLK